MIEILLSFIGIIILVVVVTIIVAINAQDKYDYHRKKKRRRQPYYPPQTAEEKGVEGEMFVRGQIGITVPNIKYVFNDYVFKIGEDTAQIDHIVVNKRGVFVIETKNYSGQIYGAEGQREWVQVLNYGEEKHKIFNPLMQNEGHIKKLKLILGDVTFHSVVVFVQGNIENLKTDKVIPVYQITQVLDSGEEVLTEAQIVHINEVLEKRNCRTEVSNAEHVQNIRIKQERIENNLCPYCNKELVLKTGKYGQFYACPNYPKCKYTKRI